MIDPELLPNGDILVPVTNDDGTPGTVRLEPGDSEHAAWLERIQRDRKGRQPMPPPDPRSGANYRPPPPPSALTPTVEWRRFPWRSAIGAVLGVVVVLWFTGALDKPLSNIGLNKNPCIQNAFGATFCGDDAQRYCESLTDLRELSDEPDACDELGY